jgi:cyclase
MAGSAFTKGLHDFGNGCFGYLQPDGGWGLSNAGLVVDGGESLLVDTLMDLNLTRDMLASMRRAVPATATIGTVVNTHSNPDHTFGNELVAGAQIISSDICLEEMRAQGQPRDSALRRDWRKFGEAGAFFNEVMWSRFDHDAVTLTLPTRSFSGELSLSVGRKEVRLVEVGPAHTGGDIIAYVPGDRTVFAGDILFINGHPIVWAGPAANWIKACDLILGWDVETIVPGHGPITDKDGVRAVKRYLEYVWEEARKRYDAGMSYEEAARDIPLAPFADWIDPERIVLNVFAAYREFAGDTAPFDRILVLSAAARLYFERKKATGTSHN